MKAKKTYLQPTIETVLIKPQIIATSPTPDGSIYLDIDTDNIEDEGTGV